MLRGSVVLLALVLTAPLVLKAFTDPAISLETVIVRFLIAIPVAAVLLGLLRLVANRREDR